ncbi:phage tail tape measure protein [Ancylobacter defluvii]|uniref:Phage tail tape measure protein n=1 Tax=Ancylobacter defluvii TaxID=1282440 RepID=A0A9W6K034_9HYPH|nr:phage tail tape measure protein [Ancylobacter defluvii]MBS7586402.1 phage tail tape measure protein [Ancylobacter defluvii]GLK85683.1 phage tail tape measure protein [Ancylobacter defluvii]
MAGRTMDVSVLVRLVDHLTAPLTALQRKFAQFAQLGQRIGILGAAAAAISFAAPIASAAAFDQVLRDIVVTAGLSGNAAEARIRSLAGTYSELALQVGIASSDLAKAGGLLIASGMDDALVNKLMPTIGRVSKAASALPDDVAKVGFALTNSLGVPAEQVELALAKLVTAGKLGRFEFRDMAKELPELAAQFTKFKINGMEAVETLGASLQIAMFGTDNTSAAANNFKNYLSKVLSPDAVKNFKDFGVDILGVMQNAAAKGINPVEASIQKVMKLTGVSQKQALDFFKQHKKEGMSDAQAATAAVEQIRALGGSGKLSQIFGDMQVLDFLLPMLANIEKYQEFKKEIQNAGLDVIAKDFQTQWEGLQTQVGIGEEIMTQAARRVGNAFGANVPILNQWGIAALGWVQQIDAAYPGVIDTVLGVAGAFLVLVAGLAVLVPVMSVLSAAFGVLASIVGFVLSPIGLVVAALAGLAYLIYADWENFAPFFQEIWGKVQEFGSAFVDTFKALFRGDWAGVDAGLSKMKAAFTGAGPAVLGIIRRLGSQLLAMADQAFGGVPSKLVKIVRGIGLMVGAAWTALSERWGPGLASAAQSVIDWATGLPGSIVNALGGDGGAVSKWFSDLGPRALAALNKVIDDLSNMSDADWIALGTNVGNAIADGLKAAVDGLASFFSGLPGKILSWIGTINLGGIIRWPTLPGGLGGGGANDNTPQIPQTDPMGNPTGPVDRQGFAPAAGGNRFAAAVPGGRAQIGGQIVVSAAPGSQIERAESSNADVPMKVANNGRMVGRV